MAAATSERDGGLLVVAAAVLWGTTGTAQALGPDGASSIVVGASRNVVGALVLVAVAALRRRLGDPRALPRRALLLGAGATAAYQLCFFGGVRLAGVAIGTVVGVGSGPVWGGLLGWLGRGERPSRRWLVATALALGGAALLATSQADDGGRVDLLGVVLALGAGLSYAAFALWSKDLTEEHDPDVAMTWVFVTSAVVLLPVGLVAGAGPLVSGSGLAMVLWLGVVSLAASYLLFGRGIRGVPVATATTLSLAEPLTAAALGVVVLDEGLSAQAVTGMALVFAALAALALHPSMTRRRPPPPDL
ncbi:MAG TPA: EamA family transporter [Acidimicrobiales bacterium]|nr:EamA family transporter [Acidimicrobiales bacterium]